MLTPPRLVLDHTRLGAMHADEAQSTQQMDVLGQQSPQFVFHGEAVLQQQDLRTLCSGPNDQRRKVGVLVVLAPTSSQSQGGIFATSA